MKKRRALTHSIRKADITDSNYLTESEIADIMTILPDEKGRLLFLVALDSGVRASEIGTMRWDTMNWAKQTVIIRDHKKDRWRHVYLSATIIRRLKTTYAALSKRDRERRPFIFMYTSPKTANRHLKAWAKAAGISRRVHWHMFRKTLSVRLHKRGVPDKAIAYQLGDTIQTVREYYLSVNSEDMQKYINDAAKGAKP